MTEFKLEIITPERVFFSGMVEYVTVEGLDGQLTVLSGHAPTIAALKTGRLNIMQGGREKPAFLASGFMEVLPDATLIFAQKCEWPEEIDESRARADEEEASERLQKRQSIIEYKESQIMLMRALSRLKIKGQYRN